MPNGLSKDMIEDLFSQIVFRDDKEAFRKLFSEFFSPLCVFAHRYVADKAACEDIVQDVFFRIWKDRGRIQIVASARNYLITTVRNACIDYIRHQEFALSYRDRQQKYSAESEVYDSSFVYGLSELEGMFLSSLAKMPENIRKAFEMHRLEGKTYPEIAQQQGISEKTVEAYISKALKQLRRDLKDYLPFFLCFFG